MTPTYSLTWDELEALARAATPGPWWPQWGGEPGYVYSVFAGKVVAEVPHEKSDAVRNNSRYIAAANPDRVLALLAELRRLAELVARVDERTCPTCGRAWFAPSETSWLVCERCRASADRDRLAAAVDDDELRQIEVIAHDVDLDVGSSKYTAGEKIFARGFLRLRNRLRSALASTEAPTPGTARGG